MYRISNCSASVFSERPVVLLSHQETLAKEIASRIATQSVSLTVSSDASSISQLLAVDFSAKLYLLDVTELSVADAREKFDQVIAQELFGPIVAIGTQVSGREIARWTRAGLADYINWPSDATSFESVITRAFRICDTIERVFSEYSRLKSMLESFSDAERSVLDLILQGVPNKCIASRMYVSQRTIEVRRQKIYRKMEANTLAELVRKIDRLDWLQHELRKPSYLVRCVDSQLTKLNVAV